MKKRIYSILSMFLIAITCVLASACGNKYKKMEFQVLYAFSADAKTWHDGTDGIFIAYDENDELIEGEEQSSLIFDENNQASLFIKVKIKNVKSKHLGSIAMSFASVSGLEFAPTMIARNKVVEVPVSKDVRINTVLKLHESNSGKSFSTNFKVSKRLESMSADLTINPAMFSTSTLNLANLTNDIILYNPDKSETNETGVKYSIGGIGNCTVTGFSEIHNAEQSLNFVDLTDNILQITDASFIANSNAIKIVATSVFHDGVKNPDDLISTEFYVYVVKTFTKQDSEELLVPTVKFEGTEVIVGEEIHLYENGGDYATSTLEVDLANDVGSVSINTYNGTGVKQVNVGEFVYVKSANGSFTKYNFVGENQQEGINGLSVYNNQNDSDVEQSSYKFAIFDRNIQTNTMKIAYEFDGLNFSYSENCPVFEKEIIVNKLAVPRYITINDVLDLEHNEKATGVIYITSSQSYEGLYVKVNANPTTDANHEIKISKSSDLIIVSDKHGNTNFETISSGASIIIRLKEGATGNEYVTFETLCSPSFYNGKTVDEKQYIRVKYNIQKVVTANELTFVSADGEELTSNSYIKAQGGGFVYIKANYSGTSMDGNTVKLISNNDSIVFANGTKETTLNDVGSSVHIPGDDYLIYKVQIKSPNSLCVADINAIAADGAIDVSAQIKVESVNVASSKNLRVAVSSDDAVAVNKAGLSNCFLLANSDFAEFRVDLISQTLYQTNAIKKVQLQRDTAVDSYVKTNTIPTSPIFTAVGIGCGTNKFTIKIDYFTVDEYGNVVVQSAETAMQIAVFNPIKNINVSADKQSISYVSAYYEEVGTTNITYKTSSFIDEAVSDKVKFIAENGEPIEVDNITGVKVTIASDLHNLDNYDFDGLSSFQNKTYYDEEETLTLVLKNDRVVSILDKLQFRFTAVTYGTSTSVSKTIEININKVNKATGIEISGEDVNIRNDNQIQDKDMIDDAKINMSFMKVAADGYAEAEFDAKILFNDSAEGIKLDKIDKDLTYVLYEYRIDSQGKYIQEWDNDVNAYVYAKEKLPRDFFNVTIVGGKINVKAFKENKGGIFQLVLATKDSYNQADLKAEDEIGYKDFNNIRTITIEVEDGEKHEYHITKASDLELINTNLDKKFALYNDIIVENDLKPLGYVNGRLVEFIGRLSGTPTGSNTQYSITQTLSSSVRSTSYGDVSGLFGIVGQNGIVENLTYIMKFKSVGVGEQNFKSDSEDGLKIGGISAVNLGTIQNVKLITNSGANLRTESHDDLYVGGIAGLNKGTIKHSSVVNELVMQIDATAPNVNAGLIAGRNENEIIGAYQGKDDLNNYVFDVISNLIIKPSSRANVAVVAGENVGQIKNIIIGGKIELTTNNGNLGGFAGKSSKLNTAINNPLIDTCVALSLDLINTNGVAGGVVAEANNVKINYVKFVSAETEFTFKPDNKTEIYTRKGVINGNIVGGVIGRAGTDVEINESSVESFIANNTVVGNTVGGLVASGDANVDNSFVKANLEAANSGVYTSAGDLTNVYYVGTATGSFTENDETYYYVESKNDLSDYMISREANSIANWDYIYRATDADVNENTQFVKAVQAEALEGTWYYYELDVTKWTNYITETLISGWSKVNGNATKNYNTIWEIQGNYNTKRVNGVDLFLPYLLKNGSNEPLMIVEPKYISASINENYVTKKDSDKINDYQDTKENVTIAESVVVNFFKDAGDEVNSYALIADKNEDNGLLDITLLPENAQGGYGYRIKEGGQFAYISNDRKLVIINESGCERILIEVYSVFNPQCKTYVAIYSQCLLTEVQLNSNKLEKIDSAKYETSLFVGQEDLIVSLDAVNQVKGVANRIDYVSILDMLDSDFDREDVAGLYNSETNEWNLVVNISSDKRTESVLDFDSIVEVSDFANISFAIRSEANLSTIVEDYHEIITLSLCLRKEYFAHSYVQSDVEIGYATLVIYPYNSAEAILVNGDDIEMFSKDEMSFDVFLKTQAVPAGDKTLLEAKVKIEDLKSNNGLIVIDEEGSPRDSIRVEFEIDADSESEIARIKSEINSLIRNEDDKIDYFTELFDVNIYRDLYRAQDERTILGFKYNFNLMLKNERLYRALENSINFKIKIVAKSNPAVNNGDGLEVEIRPTQLSTIRMESYAVKEIKYNTDYSEKIIENDNEENNIIQPGSAGNLMMIYLEPSYSQVKSIKIKSSIINVPKLGDTMISFNQLIYDENKHKFTTLYGADVPNQNVNVLELNKVTTRNGQIDNYTGVIYVWMQLPRFAGIETIITVSLEVETADSILIEQSKDLITAYLPDASVSFDENKMIKDPSLKNAYYIQKGTSANQLKITVIGYEFESNPDINISWDPVSCEDYLTEGNNQIIKWNNERKYVGDYINWELDENFDAIEKDESNNSYTLTLNVEVAEDLMAPIKLSVKMWLIANGQRVSSTDLEGSEDDYVVLWPTDYLITSYGVNALSNGRKNVAINSSSSLDLYFKTENDKVDYSEEIFKLMTQTYRTENGLIDKAKMASMFTFYKEEVKRGVDFADTSIEEFTFDVVTRTVNGNTTYMLQLFGVAQFKKTITLAIPYYYVRVEDGLGYKLSFAHSNEAVEDDYGTPLVTTFELNIFAVNSQNEIPIYTAEEIYDSKSGKWNLVEGVYYILMNDIELENVVPITTKIGQLDGNNRIISIKSFKIDDNMSEYGLFANIGTYTTKNPLTEQEEQKQTILKNVIVDYGKLVDGTIPLSNVTTETLSIGGLVGVNNGGLIYNCDVVNTNTNTKVIDVIVPLTAHVKFGGMVGDNSGIITNSRVGTSSYERVTVLESLVSQKTIPFGGLTFQISHNVKDETGNNFQNDFAGFAGVNSGTISNSFVTRTNLINYSTNEQLNNTAGFVATNNGVILSSYVKSDEQSISIDSARSTGYVIEQKGNGIVAGFVYANNGTISNSYANIELKTKSAYISGFVYSNSRTISESYSASTMNSGSGDNNAEQPFIGVNNAGELLSFGTIKNSYYLMRSTNDNPYKQGNKPVAHALNDKNFQIADNLTNFAFVLGNSVTERKQGIWSYYTLENKRRILPEIMSANYVAFSFRTEQTITNKTTGEKETIFTPVAICDEGTQNNPFTIANVEEYNEHFTLNKKIDSRSGYFRLINNISFLQNKEGESQAVSIDTRTDYVLGSEGSVTSFEGNGLTISDIYLDVETEEGETIKSIGLFAEINNAYIKNLKLEFAKPSGNGQFSTTEAIYSGGLAGKISNSAIMNINITGNNTTLVGSNFVGGLAGLIDGKSLIYGVQSSVNVKSENPGARLFYNKKDYTALNVSKEKYDSYLQTLSYAGGIAGVLDFEQKDGVEYNIQSVSLRGDLMLEKHDKNGAQEPNIMGQYSGGVAGYASSSTNALRLNYVMGKNEWIYGEQSVGGLFGVSLGRLVASQVSAVEENQYEYDTEMGKYFIQIAKNKQILLENPKATVTEATLNENAIGNTNLLHSKNNVGGLIGIGLGAVLNANYAKASVKDGSIVGGLIGLNVASDVTYSYAVTYVNSSEKLEEVGGLFGLVCPVKLNGSNRHANLKEYSKLIDHETNKTNNSISSIKFTYSTVVVDETFKANNVKNIDYVAGDYKTDTDNYLSTESSESLKYVYAGIYSDKISNNTKQTNNALVCEAYELYNLAESVQELTFNDVFSAWSVVKYWSLDHTKYLPLLTTKVVDNFIIIDEADDFKLIENNPSANYKIVDDITVDVKDANWIIDCKQSPFSGILLGEKEADLSRPKVYIMGLNPKTAGDTAGFINKCEGAKISNIEIVWLSQTTHNLTKPSINLKNVGNLTYVSGLVCEDEGSLISNVLVRSENEMINESSASSPSIQGFGGIVGLGCNTSILSCDFAGKVTVKLDSVNSALMVGKSNAGIGFGGIAGVLVSSYGATDKLDNEVEQLPEQGETGNEDETDTEDTINLDTAMISGCNVGASKAQVGADIYPQTKFNITICSDNAYIGGVVGKTFNVAIATTSIGGLGYEDDYTKISLDITLQNSKNVHVGGLGGELQEGVINSITDLIDIKLKGNGYSEEGTVGYEVNVGGIAGQYSLAALKSLSTGVRKSSVQANIVVDKLELIKSVLNISTGFGQLASNAKVEQCLFDGSVNTNNEENNLPYVNAGSIAGCVTGNAYIQEVITKSEIYAGENNTDKLYVGGFFGDVNGMVNIESSATWGRIVPITSPDASEIFAGGFVGKASEIKASNSYSLTSVIMSMMANKAIKNLNAGALVGKIETEDVGNNAGQIQATSTNILFNNVYYSSDIALCVDENYDENNNPIGINLAAYSMVTGSAWSENLKSNGSEVWTTFSGTNIPHVSALTDSLQNYDIALNNAYKQGSVMNPKIISTTGPVEFGSEYTYYIINTNHLPIFKNSLSGILIGSDVVSDGIYGHTINDGNAAFSNVDDSNSATGIIAHVKSDSAISNLHINLGNRKTYDFNSTSNNGFIAGKNEGVIFNCSVQGSLVNIVAGGSVGLIAGNNSGIISHSYSSAEISTEAEGVNVSLAGITYTNSGKLLSNYFTGYLNSNLNDGAAGIFMSEDSESVNTGYLFNNYMGGVVVESAKNAFAGCSTFEGSNNYIDKYSDVSLWEPELSSQNANLISIKTADLMKNVDKNNEQYLKGSWVTVLNSDGTFEEQVTDEQGNNIDNHYFGRNYNYPIYRFNKMTRKNNAYDCIDYQKQLKTGNGISTLAEDDNLHLAERYKALTELDDSGNQTTEYTNAFKILHYGILQSVHALLGQNRNYVLMYDVDATNIIDGSLNGTKWTAIGSGEAEQDIDGFVKQNAIGFNGVFVTNRHFAQSLENSICSISGLSGQGLFDNITHAYIGKINLGSFYKLQASGAIGVKVGTENANNATVQSDDSQPAELANVFVDSITFKKGSEISSGKFDEAQNAIPTPDAGEEAGTHYGALFGSINNIHVNISNFSSASTEGSSNLVLKGSPYDYVGLIAGMSENSTITFSALEGEVKNENKLIALFKGNGFAGGLIGSMSGGILNASNNVVHLARFDDTGSAVVAVSENNVYYTNVLGGIVGISSGSTEIKNANVKFYSSKNLTNNVEEVDVYANSFGGFVGYAQGGVHLTGTSTLNIQGEAINFNVSSSAKTVYCGLVVGCSLGTTQVDKLSLSPDNNGKTFVVRVKNDMEGNAIAQSTGGVVNNVGIGSFVGCQSGDLIITNYDTKHIIQLEAEGVPNLGGIVGCYYSGEVHVDLQSSRENIGDSEPFFILIGTENVGGIAGYAGSVDSEAFMNSAKDKENRNLLSLDPNEDKGFALILVRGSKEIASHKNFGGLFGVWSGLSTSTVGENSVEEDGGNETLQNSVTNINTIVIGSGFGVYKYDGNNKFTYTVENKQGSNIKIQNPQAMNIGGIAGTVTNSISNLVNYAEIQSLSGNAEDMHDIFGTDITNTDDLECKLLNVGGIVGLATGTVSNSRNKAKVVGYQNVGGIVGGVTGEDESIIAKLELNTSEGEVRGVINVGGIVGYANDSNILQNNVLGKVYGNANVGGLIGLSIDTAINTNKIGSNIEEDDETAQSADESESMTVSGISYTRKVDDSHKDVYIPTSVGGLVGTVKNSQGTDYSIENNTLINLNVTSTKEGLNQPEPKTISVIENNMVPIDLNGLSMATFDTIFVYDDKCVVKFKETYSGYGGFIGTIDLETIKDVGDGNTMGSVKINPTYGINVGSFYGAYTQTEEDVDFEYPQLVADVWVAGSYNVGGIIGYQHTPGSQQLKFKEYIPTAQENEETPKIHVQDGEIGIYVGGLIGKTDAETIEGLTLDSTAQIQLYTNKSYYIGGLIGQAQVDGNTYFAGLAISDTDIVAKDNDKMYNFGAFIGMLKVGANSGRLNISINGTHKEFFTINAIENCNYADGQSAFRPSKDATSSNKLYLHAQAYYINQDNFNIVGSGSVPNNNPLNSQCYGWAYDYTTVRTIQRCIPAEQNNGATWDSIGVVYDAKNIVRVENGLDTIIATEYEEEPGQVKRYTKDGILTPLYDSEGEKVTKYGKVYEALENMGYSTDNPLRKGFPGYQGKMMVEVLKHEVPIASYAGENDWKNVKGAFETLQEVLKKAKNFNGKTNNGIYKEELFVNNINGANGQIYFMAMTYDEPKSNSGSIFEVAGKAPAATVYSPITSNQTLAWWQWTLIIIGAIIYIAALVITEFFSGGSATPLWLIITAKIIVIAGAVGMIIVTAVQLSRVTSARSTMYFLSTPNQSAGFLSSSYARKITLSDGIVVNTTDDIEMSGEDLFQPISYDRLSDYQSGHYYKIAAVETDNGKLTIVNSDKKTISIDEYEKLKKQYTFSNEITLCTEEGVQATECEYENYTEGGTTYVIIPRYLYINGQYWINCIEAKVSHTPYVNVFDATNLDDWSTDQDTEEKVYNNYNESLYMATSQGNYVYGKYSETDGYEFDKSLGNYITAMDNDGKNATLKVKYQTGAEGEFSGVTIKDPTATKDVQFYYVDNKPEVVELGYTYMAHVYYGPDGVEIEGLNPMYAIYGDETDSKPNGKEGYEYIVSSTEKDGNGNITKTWYKLLKSFTSTPTGTPDVDYKIIYPQSFTNPYTTTVTGTNRVESHFEAVSENELNGSDEEETNSGEESTVTISHTVTYFKHIGDFIVEGSYNQTKDRQAVYLPLDRSLNPSLAIPVYEEGNEGATSTKVALKDLTASNIDDYYIKQKNGDGTNSYVSLSTAYLYANGKLYQKNSNVFFCQTNKTGADYGQLVEGVASYVGENEQYCYGKYVSHFKCQLYTRYKYSAPDLNKAWKKEDKTNAKGEKTPVWYQLYPNESGNTINGSPNIGVHTYLCEVVKVSLTGIEDDANGRYVYSSLENNSTKTPAGSFKVIKKTS